MLPQRKNFAWLPSLLGEFINSDLDSRYSERAPINIFDSEDKYLVEISAPGIPKEMFDIEVVGENQLVVKVDTKDCQREKKEGGKYLRKEFCCYHFNKTLLLPENVDKLAIKARKDDGILHIEIPKKPKEVNVELIKKVEVD